MTFSVRTESWRALVRELNGNERPEDFLMAWINYESGGNPAALGAATEVGIFQIDMQDGPRYGGSVESLHTNFAPYGKQTATRDLTDAERRLQVTTGLAMVDAFISRARSQLSAAGADWPEGSADFWSWVKWQHNLPAYSAPMLSAFKSAHNGRAPATFDELADWFNALPSRPSFVNERYWNTGGAGLSKYTKNAARVGQYGGVERLASSWVALVVIAFVLYMLGR